MEKKLYKSAKDKKICGVCAGIAKYFSFDPTLVRLAFCLLCGGGIFAYIICAIVIPDEPSDSNIIDSE